MGAFFGRTMASGCFLVGTTVVFCSLAGGCPMEFEVDVLRTASPRGRPTIPGFTMASATAAVRLIGPEQEIERRSKTSLTSQSA